MVMAEPCPSYALVEEGEMAQKCAEGEDVHWVFQMALEWEVIEYKTITSNQCIRGLTGRVEEEEEVPPGTLWGDHTHLSDEGSSPAPAVGFLSPLTYCGGTSGTWVF